MNAQRTHSQMVLSFLVEAGNEFTSGEALSDKLGLSRAAVFKHVESLRKKGYGIEAAAGRGYRLVEVPDRLTPLELSPLINTHDIGRTVHYREVATSTSEIAFRLASEGALHGEVVVAEKQTAGRGRRGRTWISPAKKNLYLSVVLRPELLPQDAPQLTFVAAVATAEAIRDAGCEATLKWPNDVEIGSRKVAGILTELSAEPGRVNFVVVGIGVNLNAGERDFPEELRGRATSIFLARGAKVPRALFCAALCSKLEAWYDRFADEGFAGVIGRWRELDRTLGRQVSVLSGTQQCTGLAQDVDGSGALLVKTEGGAIERVVAGDVQLAPPR